MPDNTSEPAALARTAQRKAIGRRRRAANKAGTSSAAPTDSEPKLSPTQRTGRQGEALAARYLASAGARVLAHNLQCRAGELDLVCLDGAVLAFVEVRLREDARFGGAAASVGPAKQRRLAQAAAYFLPRLSRIYFSGRTPLCRFDVVAIEGEQLVWLKGVFNSPL